MQTEVAPGLLLSMPHLLDPNFARAVVLMVEHSDEGSFGLIINHPSSLAVSELLEALDITWRGSAEAVVWSGGPVTPETGWVLHEPGAGMPAPATDNGTVEVAPGIALSTSQDVLRGIAGDPPERVRFLLGYAGWGPGQLVAEMVHGSWLHADASPELVFDTPPGDLWETAIRSVGIDPETLIPGHGVH